tara:strand:- start:276 stop:383 length:108 start_codon:yes stop_codon:yes gene_type:complete
MRNGARRPLVAIAGEFRSHLRSLGQAPPREALKTE